MISVRSGIWQDLGLWEPMRLTKGCHIRDADPGAEYATILVVLSNMVAR